MPNLPLFSPGRRGVFAVIMAGVFLLVGCGPRDEIRTYDAKRDANDAKPTGGTGPVRLLGAVIPVDVEKSYFVKFTGPVDQIAPHEKAFDEFLASIRILPGGPPTFTAPAGWKDGGKRQMRLTTFIAPGEGKQPELYISDPFAGTLLQNVNRWQDEVGVPRATEADLPKVTTEVMLGTTKAYKVDLKGPGGKKSMPPFAGGK